MDTSFTMYTTYCPEIRREQCKEFLYDPEYKDIWENEIGNFNMSSKNIYKMLIPTFLGGTFVGALKE